MDTLFRIFMLIFPYALSIAAYVWAAKKAWRVTNKIAKVVALLILVAGVGFTVYRAFTVGPTSWAEDRFEFMVLIVNVFVLFFASIAMALGEKEVDV